MTGPRISVPHWRAPTFERTRDYHLSLRRAGGEPLALDSHALPRESTGLLLTGGADVDPHLYRQRRSRHCQRPNKARDAHELGLLRQALERDVPVLAVCRGLQLLNIALGGALLQHIETDDHRDHRGASRWHPVTLTGSSRLAETYAPRRSMRVNSRHHQGLTPDLLAPGLLATACSPDGLVEAAESPAHRWVVGVQWHPERPEMRPDANPLFEAFVAACRR